MPTGTRSTDRSTFSRQRDQTSTPRAVDSRSFYEGAVSVVSGLQDEGYIKIRENDGEIIGLCNQDQDNFHN